MSGHPREYIAKLSPWQRSALGFAKPGDSYWTADTLKAVPQRYHGMNMEAYVVAARL